jgi:hypothetical protein
VRKHESRSSRHSARGSSGGRAGISDRSGIGDARASTSKKNPGLPLDVEARQAFNGLLSPENKSWEDTTLKRRHFLVLGLLVLMAAVFVGAGVLWFARNPTGSYRIIMRGGRSFFGDVGVSGGNLFLVSGKPAVLFGTVAKPGAQEEFCYVLVFRHTLSAADLASLGSPMDLGTSGEGRKQESRAVVAIQRKRIEARYEVEWNETFTEVTREALSVGGQSKELNAGKVFLVDLAGQAPVYLQKNLKSMPSVTPLASSADVERLVEALLRSLENQDAETRAFLR